MGRDIENSSAGSNLNSSSPNVTGVMPPSGPANATIRFRVGVSSGNGNSVDVARLETADLLGEVVDLSLLQVGVGRPVERLPPE